MKISHDKNLSYKSLVSSSQQKMEKSKIKKKTYLQKSRSESGRYKKPLHAPQLPTHNKFSVLWHNGNLSVGGGFFFIILQLGEVC